MNLVKYLTYLILTGLFSTQAFSQAEADIQVCGLSGKLSKGRIIELFTEVTGLYVTFSSNQLSLQDSSFTASDCLPARILLESILEPGMQVKWYPDKVILYSLSEVNIERQTDIFGTVVNAITGERLIAATVYLPDQNKGTTTDESGFFNLENVPVNAPILISYVGYQPLFFYADPAASADQYNLYPSIQLEAVEVLSERYQSFELLSNPDKKFIPADPYNAGPFLGGEPDILKMIQNETGVLANEVISGPVVRGGSPDQNLVLLDDVPLYDYNHLLGFVSIFNSDIINRVDFYKGNFPSKFGGRLSSVIDIKTKDGSRSKWGGNLTLGLFSQKVELDGPLDSEGRYSVIASGRIATLKPLIQALPIEEIKGFSPDFWDMHLKATGNISDKDKLSLLAFRTMDRLNNTDSNDEIIAGIPVTQTQEESLNWGNDVLSLKWHRRWSRKLFSNTTLFLTNFEFSSQNFQSFRFTLPDEVIEESYDFFSYSSIRDRGFKSSWDFHLNERSTFNAGIETIFTRFNPSLKRADRLFEDHEKEEFKNEGAYNTASVSSYAEWNYKLSAKAKIVTGLRYSFFTTESQNYHRWEPRFSFVWEMLPRLNVHGGYSRTAQFIHLLGTPIVGYPTDLWVPSTSGIRPQIADQLFINFSTLLNDRYYMQLGAYYKSLDHIITLRDGSSSISQNWEGQIISGAGHSRGIEFSIEKIKGKWQWGANYTLSRSLRKFSEINNGEAFPFRFDRPHDLKLKLNYHLSKESQVGIQWTLSSGQPFTVGVLSFQPQGPPGIAYPPTVFFGARNNERMPWLHRFDISVRIKREKEKIDQQWSIGLYNLYNRFNPFAVQVIPEEQSQQILLRETSLYPLLPFLTYKLSF